MSSSDSSHNTLEGAEDTSLSVILTAAGLPDDPTVPDIYADGANLQLTLSGINIIFTRTMKNPPVPVPVTIIRLSAPQALILTQVLRKVVGAYQQQIGPIQIPDVLLEALQIGREL